MVLTEFHLVLLYNDRIAAISILNERLVYEEFLPLVSTKVMVEVQADFHVLKKHGEVVRALTADPVRKTYWISTDQSLFELIVDNEDRDVWKINLQKENFDVALRYVKARHHINFVILVLTHMESRQQDREISSSLRTHTRYSRQSGTSRQPRPLPNVLFRLRTSR
jgi:vacuolar protein sorting-associated protein 18